MEKRRMKRELLYDRRSGDKTVNVGQLGLGAGCSAPGSYTDKELPPRQAKNTQGRWRLREKWSRGQDTWRDQPEQNQEAGCLPS